MNQEVREIAKELEANPLLRKTMEEAIELSHEGREDLIKYARELLEVSKKSGRGSNT